MSKQKPDNEFAKKTSTVEELSDATLENVTGGRDAASGMATGRRQHKPIEFVKEVDVASPKL
jgi:type VI protein secretion system component Hcp